MLPPENGDNGAVLTTITLNLLVLVAAFVCPELLLSLFFSACAILVLVLGSRALLLFVNRKKK